VKSFDLFVAHMARGKGRSSQKRVGLEEFGNLETAVEEAERVFARHASKRMGKLRKKSYISVLAIAE
jgi:hypothetical protein